MVFSGVVNCFNIIKRYWIYYCEEKKNCPLCCWPRALCFIVISSEKIHFLAPLKLSNNTFNYWKLNHWKIKSKLMHSKSSTLPNSPSEDKEELLLSRAYVNFFIQFADKFVKDLLPWPPTVLKHSLVNLRNNTREEGRRQTLCDKRDNNLFEKSFSQTSPSFKQIIL